ncbi:MAG: N-acetyl-gamma-glutamyl-phosphate reductase [Candidatus Obscuribacterales bacterium]|nr:N-acetyl-gamma-glutamyl-phosphate reductase [Candidatus Obscuribacterales bacterium]
MIKVGIAGATGYTGQELVRILNMHSGVKLQSLLCQSQVGQQYSALFPSFLGEVDQLLQGMDQLEAASQSCDVLFLALPHGVSANLVNPDMLAQTKVIDLGADFRLKDPFQYDKWYESAHPAPHLLSKAVYGLPEYRRSEIKKAKLVANPGCYATATILALQPLVSSGLLDSNNIIVDAKSGVSGAGRALSLGVHYNECNENLKAYKVASHRHTPEIEQELSAIGGKDVTVSFTAHLVPMSRGILATTYAKVKAGVTEQDLIEVYESKFGDEPFVKVLGGESPETKWVRDSNNCHIAVNVDERTGNAIIISAIDNLIKGAAGQAVQNMNLICGINETAGLSKSSVLVH